MESWDNADWTSVKGEKGDLSHQPYSKEVSTRPESSGKAVLQRSLVTSINRPALVFCHETSIGTVQGKQGTGLNTVMEMGKEGAAAFS